MRSLVKGILLCLLLIPAAARADEGLIRLSLIDGDVQVLIQDTTDWTPATINLPLNEHDRVWVSAGGRAELQIQGGVYARADGDTSLDILTVNSDSAQFYLDQGHVYINNRRGGIGTVQIDTPLASLRTYDNSIIMVDVAPDGENEISVLKGTVYAESRAGSTSVSAGSTLTIHGENSAEISPISAPDSWEQWNVDRDRQVTAWSESSRYLPGELHEYSSDFDQNGSWGYDSQYGYVWYPAAMPPDWAPYSYGSWVWIRSNYVWIDYDPWGWAPFHYGRWVFGVRGWCWVPPTAGAVYWGPGYVGWVSTPTYVAWVPLAPGEIYYGYGYYGPGSVNITTINVNTVVVNKTYRNAGAPHSVLTVDRKTFGTGKGVLVKPRENPFEARVRPAGEVNIVPPRVRPEHPIVITPQPGGRQSRPAAVPDDRERKRPEARPTTQPEYRGRQEQPARSVVTPPSTLSRERQQQAPGAVTPPSTLSRERQQPPERVRQTQPATVKNERPLVKQREASVFHPRQPESLPVTRSSEPKVINRGPARVPERGPVQHQQEKPVQQRKQEERH